MDYKQAQMGAPPLLFHLQGAANLPFRWNALRSSLAERLVLVGDFTDLAHAQKVGSG